MAAPSTGPRLAPFIRYAPPVELASVKAYRVAAVRAASASCFVACWTGAGGKGVSVYQHADLLLRLTERHSAFDVVWIVIYKVGFNLVHVFNICRRYRVSKSK